VVLVGVGVAVWLGFDVGFRVGFLVGVVVGSGVRVLSRLGAVVRVGVAVFALVGVGVGVVRRGVTDGLVGRTGVTDCLAGASSVAGWTEVTGVSWPVTFFGPVWCTTNHPMPTSRTSAEREARSGPATPLPGDRLWFVMPSTLAQANDYQPPPATHFTNL
jgi:hypothetical protein